MDLIMDEFEKSYNKPIITKYKETLLQFAEGKVLQTCAGTNRNLKFYNPSTNLTLIDWSPNMVAAGMTKKSPTLDYKYLVADVTKMPFKDS